MQLLLNGSVRARRRPGRNKVPGQIKQGGGPDSAPGLVFGTCGVRYRSSSTRRHVGIQLSQHHLLKRLSLPQ